MTWWKHAAVAAAVVAVFTAGYQYAAALYSEDIAAINEDHAKALADKTNEYREKENEWAQRLSDAVSKRDAALAAIDDLRDDRDRLRRAADRNLAELSAAADDPCKPFKERLARSIKLHQEGADLLEEGPRLLGRIAIDKDAVVQIITPAK